MNTIYKVVWNAATQSWVAAPEFAKGHGKKSRLRKSVVAVAMVLALSPLISAHASALYVNDGVDGQCANVVDGALAGGENGTVVANPLCGVSNISDLSSAANGTMVLNANGAFLKGPLSVDGDLTLTGKQINGLAAGTVDTDAVNLGQLNSAIRDTTAYTKINGANDGTDNAVANGTNAIAIGSSAFAGGTGSVVIGNGARDGSGGNSHIANAVVIGNGAIVTGDAMLGGANGMAFGNGANAFGSGIAFGAGASVASSNALALGVGAKTGINSGGGIALGLNASVGDRATGSIAIGNGATTSADITGAVALGNGSTATLANTVSVGSDTLKRQIVNMAAGTLSATSTDAVNGSQLFATNTNVTNIDGRLTNSESNYALLNGRVVINEGAITTLRTQISEIGEGTIGLVKQDAGTQEITVAADKGGDVVNFTGTDGARKLAGVEAGELSDTSQEAVNGSQLFETNERVGAVEGDVTTLNTNVTNLDGRVTINEGDITSIKDQIDEISEGTIGLVKQDAGTQEITVAADKGGDVVNFSGTDGARKLAGVEAGELSEDSKEAVNGTQLFETNQRVDLVEEGIAVIGTSVTNLDGRVTNIEGDLNNGSIGMVRQDANGNFTVANNFGGASVDFTGTDGARVLTGVANGVNDTDAVTLAQLKAMGLVDPNDGRALGALVYDDESLGKATLGGTNGTILDNVRGGLIESGSRQAVNGGQLADIRDALQKQIGDVSDRVETIEDSIADGSIGGPGGGDGGPIDDNGGRPISNVGDGVADTDAANVGQVNKKFEQAVKDANAYTDTRFDQLQSEFNDRFEVLDGRIDRMAALSGAYAGMAMNTAGLAGKNRVGAGIGSQNGKDALAVGYQRIVGKQNNASVSIGGAFSGSEKSVTAGAGFSW